MRIPLRSSWSLLICLAACSNSSSLGGTAVDAADGGEEATSSPVGSGDDAGSDDTAGSGDDDSDDGEDAGGGDGTGDGTDSGGDGSGDGPQSVPLHVEPLDVAILKPVAGVAKNGDLHYAGIDPAGSAMSYVGPDGQVLVMPRARTVSAATMVVDAGGLVHLAWAEEGSIVYTAIDNGTLRTEHQILAAGGRAPTLARRPGGGVVLAWTKDPENAGELPLIEVARGGQDGFGPAAVANEDCCIEEEFVAEPTPASFVSGASIAVDSDDRVHMVFEWSGVSDVEIDYIVEQDGGFAAALPISYAALVPCPAIAVDESGADILYITPGFDGRLAYARVEQGEVVHESEYSGVDAPNMGLLTPSGDGTLHMMYWAQRYDGGSRTAFLSHVVLADGVFGESTELMSVPDPEMFELTPGGGGIGSDGDRGLLMPFVVRQGPAQPAATFLAIGF